MWIIISVLLLIDVCLPVKLPHELCEQRHFPATMGLLTYNWSWFIKMPFGQKDNNMPHAYAERTLYLVYWLIRTQAARVRNGRVLCFCTTQLVMSYVGSLFLLVGNAHFLTV
jgi:hypothetical protein